MVVTKDLGEIANYTLCRAETVQMKNRAAELDKGTNIQVMHGGRNFLHTRLSNKLMLTCCVCIFYFI